jgi:16S rRNA processing protein RimM
LSDPGRWLRAGTVGRPHGLDGSFHVADGVAELLVVGATVHVQGHERVIVRRAGFDARPIVRLEGCQDREAAQALRGAEMVVARDLEGCVVRDGDVEVGVVTRLIGLPSCEVLEVARFADGAQLLVPLIKDAVRTVDIEHQTIDVDLRFLGED